MQKIRYEIQELRYTVEPFLVRTVGTEKKAYAISGFVITSFPLLRYCDKKIGTDIYLTLNEIKREFRFFFYIS